MSTNEPVFTPVAPAERFTSPLSPTAAAPQPAGADGGTIDKIRDLIFGSQMQDYSQRFATIEDHLARAVGNLREEMRQRLEIQENLLKVEIKTVAGRLEEEIRQRLHYDEMLYADVAAREATLQRSLAALADRLTETQNLLQEKILGQSRELYSEIEHNQAQIAALLKREVESIRGVMTERGALGDLLAELSGRLRGDQQKALTAG